LNTGYLGKIASFLEKEFGYEKNKDFRLWKNEDPNIPSLFYNYPTIIMIKSIKVAENREKMIEIFSSMNFSDYLDEPEQEEAKDYEPYVIIATLIILILILNQS
jgi:hypothetical protein